MTIEKYRINPKSFLLWKGVQHNDGGWGKGLDSLSFQMVLSWITHFLKSLFVTFWSIETAREDIFFVKIPENVQNTEQMNDPNNLEALLALNVINRDTAKYF